MSISCTPVQKFSVNPTFWPESEFLFDCKALTPKDVQEKETVLNNVESSTAEVESIDT